MNLLVQILRSVLTPHFGGGIFGNIGWLVIGGGGVGGLLCVGGWGNIYPPHHHI